MTHERRLSRAERLDDAAATQMGVVYLWNYDSDNKIPPAKGSKRRDSFSAAATRLDPNRICSLRQSHAKPPHNARALMYKTHINMRRAASDGLQAYVALHQPMWEDSISTGACNNGVETE